VKKAEKDQFSPKKIKLSRWKRKRGCPIAKNVLQIINHATH
jgi:hypothetical protein